MLGYFFLWASAKGWEQLLPERTGCSLGTGFESLPRLTPKTRFSAFFLKTLFSAFFLKAEPLPALTRCPRHQRAPPVTGPLFTPGRSGDGGNAESEGQTERPRPTDRAGPTERPRPGQRDIGTSACGKGGPRRAVWGALGPPQERREGPVSPQECREVGMCVSVSVPAPAAAWDENCTASGVPWGGNAYVCPRSSVRRECPLPSGAVWVGMARPFPLPSGVAWGGHVPSPQERCEGLSRSPLPCSYWKHLRSQLLLP